MREKKRYEIVSTWSRFASVRDIDGQYNLEPRSLRLSAGLKNILMFREKEEKPKAFVGNDKKFHVQLINATYLVDIIELGIENGRYWLSRKVVMWNQGHAF